MEQGCAAHWKTGAGNLSGVRGKTQLYSQGMFRQEAMAFLRERLGERQYERIMMRPDSRQHPYVAARVFLSPLDWDRYVWIEQHGTLDGFL